LLGAKTEGIVPTVLLKITKQAVERLQPGELAWDTTVQGFGARRQKGDASYLLRYRFHGRQRFYYIGRHGSPWTPDTARAEALRLLGQVASGIDPLAERHAKRDRPAPASFGAELQRYLAAKQAKLKPRSFEEVERHLRQHAKPLAKLPLAEIDRRAIAARLGEIESASGAVARNRVRSSLSAFFAWAVTEGLMEINPVTGTAKADEGSSRDRVLSDDELAEVWRCLGDDQFGDIVRLLILTGQRREEIGGLGWSEIVADAIVLQPDRTKNRRQHVVPLAPMLKAIIDRQPRRKGRDLIFGYREGPFSGWSDCKAALDARLVAGRGRKAKPMPEWRLHDLRRTVATGMAELGVLPHIIEAVLNHVSGHRAGVAGIYNRATYTAECREALKRWADYVTGL
jgi:integrase